MTTSTDSPLCPSGTGSTNNNNSSPSSPPQPLAPTPATRFSSLTATRNALLSAAWAAATAVQVGALIRTGVTAYAAASLLTVGQATPVDTPTPTPTPITKSTGKGIPTPGISNCFVDLDGGNSSNNNSNNNNNNNNTNNNNNNSSSSSSHLPEFVPQTAHDNGPTSVVRLNDGSLRTLRQVRRLGRGSFGVVVEVEELVDGEWKGRALK
jgi:hypothetical protein